jgi:hypothetical protein
MARAAWDRDLDPDRLSFSHAVRLIKRKMPQAAALPPERLQGWRAALLEEIARGKCTGKCAGKRVSRRSRPNPRGVKRKMSNFQIRKRGDKLNQRHQPVPHLRIGTVLDLG